MRNSTSSSTPKANTVHDEGVSNEERPGTKKLKQARLPFKVIDPGVTSVGTKTTTMLAVTDKDPDEIKESPTDCRKRKRSYNSDDDDANGDIKEDGSVSKENFEVLTAATKKKKLSSVSNNGTTSDDCEDGDEESNEDVANVTETNDSSLNSPTVSVKNKRKGAGTPKTSSAQKDKNTSATKLQIKLPLSGGKKRRKSNHHQLSQKSSAGENSLNNLTNEISNDDIEGVPVQLNPQKRKKLSTESDEMNKLETKCTLSQQKIDVITLDSGSEQEVSGNPTKVLNEKNEFKRISNKNTEVSKDKQPKKETNLTSASEKSSPIPRNSIDKSIGDDDVKNVPISESSEEDEKQKNVPKYIEGSVPSENEADDETDNLGGKSINESSDISKLSKSKHNNFIQSVKDGRKSSSSSKNLTPKQIKLMEQRRRAREEKERKLQEEKIKKQQDKEEKELIKKREREEKEEQKRKEREEREEQKRLERQEKERKRLAEIESKNEEKRKKTEAKEEELRKKEEERKRKEQEKEEAELKKKKAAQAFTKFFVAKTPTNVQLKNEEDSNTGDGTKLLAFRPFQIKGDMKLAPICRKFLTVEGKNRLDDLTTYNNKDDTRENDDSENKDLWLKSQLYLSELRYGKILPGKWRRPSTESKDDVILIEDELERVGQEIVEDTPAYIREKMRVKFYKFHDNRRPPYYGTWRKKSSVVKPRKPFAQDVKLFDYEVDSDDEWEEEEPGESLEDGSDEDREKESEDDDYEVDNEWFVPHGHLSDEELQNEDEVGMGDDNTREAQKVKLQLLQQEFAQEMKKKTEKIKPRLIGCIWADINGNQPAECASILWDMLEKKAMLFVDPPLINEPEADKFGETNSPSGATNTIIEKVTDKLKPISLSEKMVKDLTRLIHGNNNAKHFLINEYIAFVEKTEESVRNGDLRKPLKSVVRDKIEEIAEWQSVDATASSAQEMEQAADETIDKKKKKIKRRLCWVVKQEMLDKMELSSLELKNSWKYTLQPKSVRADKEMKSDEKTTTLVGENILPTAKDNPKEKLSEISQKIKFGKISSSEKIAKGAQKTPSSMITSSTDKSSTETKLNVLTTTKEKKRVPLLISVARGQHISTPTKTKLISQFLQQRNKDSVKAPSPTTSTRRPNAATSPSVDDVVILD